MPIQEVQRIETLGGKLMFSTLKGVLHDDLERTGRLNRLGDARFFRGTQEAIATTVPTLDRRSVTTARHAFSMSARRPITSLDNPTQVE